MHPASVPARLIDAGVTVLGGTATEITYKVGHTVVTADLFVFERLVSAEPVLQYHDRVPRRRVLVVCQSISDQARSQLLIELGIDLCVMGTGELVLSGTAYRAPAAPGHRDADTASRRRLRAVERICVLATEPLRQSDIATAIGVTQQAVSRMATKQRLPDTPMTADARRTTLEDLASVRPDGGLVETYWYGIDPVVDQVRAVIGLGRELTVPVLAGGDVAADVLAPWRVPTRALVYSTELLDLADLDLVVSTAAEATLTVRVPADATIWSTAKWWCDSAAGAAADVPTVDPVVVLEDLCTSGDLDDGAIGRLTDWIVGR